MAGAAKIFVLGLPDDEKRLDLFKEFIPGVHVAQNLQNLSTGLKNEIRAGCVDVAIEASGSPKGAETALALTRKRGLVVQTGIFANPPAINMNIAVRNEITIKGTPALPERLWDRVLALLASRTKGQLAGFEAVISDVFPLSDAINAFEKLSEKKGMKILLSPP
jgi:threonine dehydrogenase-like Zn-dependent dehydrogenase